EDRGPARSGRAGRDERGTARRRDHAGVGGGAGPRGGSACNGCGEGNVRDGRAMRRLLAVAFAALALPSAVSGGTPITVFAAASLTEVLPRIDQPPRYSFAGSDQLALQLRQGAPADVYAAASPKYPELLYRQGLLRKPRVFATNRLVVLLPKANPAHV